MRPSWFLSWMSAFMKEVSGVIPPLHSAAACLYSEALLLLDFFCRLRLLGAGGKANQNDFNCEARGTSSMAAADTREETDSIHLKRLAVGRQAMFRLTSLP